MINQIAKAYSWLFANVIRYTDAESAHKVTFALLRAASRVGAGKLIRAQCAPDPALRRKVAGVLFPSPFGVAAGLDKTGEAVAPLIDLGFGFVEVGTTTALPQPGNPRKRLYRLVKDRAVLNRMGFNNPGAKQVARNVAEVRKRRPRAVIGINIGKSKLTPIADASGDYAASAEVVSQYADYLVINVSSPNTPGLRSLQDTRPLQKIITAVQQHSRNKPIFVKVAPDLSDDHIIEVAQLAKKLGLAGIIATNTTLSRDYLTTSKARIRRLGDGGISGAPLRARALKVLHLLREHGPEDLAIVSVGGVRDGQDVYERLQAGADLVQGYSEFIFSGPTWAAQINKDLARLMA